MTEDELACNHLESTMLGTLSNECYLCLAEKEDLALVTLRHSISGAVIGLILHHNGYEVAQNHSEDFKDRQGSFQYQTSGSENSEPFSIEGNKNLLQLNIDSFMDQYVDTLPMTFMQLRLVDELGYLGRNYKFFNESILYPFGNGLHYKNFSYKVVSVQKSVEKKLVFN